MFTYDLEQVLGAKRNPGRRFGLQNPVGQQDEQVLRLEGSRLARCMDSSP